MPRLKSLLLLLMALGLASLPSCREDAAGRVATARAHVQPELGEFFGAPVFIRIIKEARTLELWVQRGSEWSVLKSYPIAGMSGTLGPKLREGDKQAPEGFYDVVPGRMNPNSRFHLAFNIGYPNSYDRSQGRTGSFIMVHGSTASVGCFAMTDAGIEEIYTMVNEAFKAGQKRVRVHIYPFEMTAARMEKEKDSPNYAFWCTLQDQWRRDHERQRP